MAEINAHGEVARLPIDRGDDGNPNEKEKDDSASTATTTATGATKPSEMKYDLATGRKLTGFAASTWPLDHADSSRTKFTLGAGLPQELDPDRIRSIRTPLEQSMWIYTAGEHSELIYVVGGKSMFNPYVAKFDSQTLELLQKYSLPRAMYFGGALVHPNGNVYVTQSNRLYSFAGGDLDRATHVVLPSSNRQNGALAQSNGMILTSDNKIVIKQWSLYLQDTFGWSIFILSKLSLDVFPRLVVLAGMLAILIQYLGWNPLPKARNRRPSLSTVVRQFFKGAGLFAFVVLCVVAPNVVPGKYNLLDSVLTGLPFWKPKAGSELKIIDPDTLQVEVNLVLRERCSFGRMALTAVSEAEDALVLIGDEFIRQYRYKLHTQELYEVEDWAVRYRRPRDGTFPGTGPTIYKGVTYFTDNTFPIFLANKSYSIFRRELVVPDNTAWPYRNEIQRRPVVDPAMDGQSAGFMFWSVVIAPQSKGVIVWDIANDSVQMREQANLELRWSIRAASTDCISMAADKGHVYMVDHSQSCGAWYKCGFFLSKPYDPDFEKYLIVADEITGDILLNYTVFTGGTARPSIIAPGANDDIIMADSEHLYRIYQEKKPEAGTALTPTTTTATAE